MPRIPASYDLSGPENLRSGRVISSYDVSAIGRGLESFGNDLGQIAADQKQQNDTVDLSRTEAYWLKKRLDIQNQVNNDPDYSTYTKRYPGLIDQAKNESANLIRDPRMREKWLANAELDTVRANDFLSDKYNEKQKNAEVAALGDANLTDYNIIIDPNSSEDAKTKARSNLDGSITMAQHTGLLTPQEASEKRWKLLQGSYDEQGRLDAEAGKLNVPNVDTLTKAMINVESQNNPNAESDKGASGLMQVMPDTAVGLAKELGDQNFPTDPAKQKEYLKDPNVSLIYGKRYMSDMLAKYGGDEQAALIAYNGGPARADAWLKAGRDDSAIPQETADYYKKVLNGTGPQGPQVAADPAQVSTARTYLLAHSSKGPESIQGLKDGFALKLSNMLQGAPPEIRDKLGLFSGFRSTEHQAELFDAAVKKYGSVEAARKWVAPPGKSNHNAGLAADLSYNGGSLKDAPPEVVNWLHQNADKYGLKFPLGNENWHVEDASTRNGVTATATIAAKSFPSYWDKMSPEARINAQQIMERKQKERSVEDRSVVDTAINNAPTAIQNTGQYTGQIPNVDQFNSAYGPIEGPSKQQEFQTAIDTSRQVHDFQTMSGADIQTIVKDAEPKSTGDTAALETAKFSVLSKAAATTIAAREADPVTYVRSAFPNVDKAWQDATQTGNYQDAITATMAAQQHLGIRNPDVLPKDVASIATEKFKDATQPENARISAITGLVFASKDPAQRNAIFNQLVAAGLPDATQGAVEAFARGDDGAGRRLFQAAIIDPSKLPGVDAAKQTEIDQSVQSKLMDKGQIGNVYYGLSDGTADNFERAQRDAKLIKNSVLLRMTNGEDMDTAIDNTAKDLYGDLQLIQGDGRVNTQVLLPKGVDPTPVIDGLAARLPEVEKIISDTVSKVPLKLEPGTSNEAVMKAVRENYAKNVSAQGYFKTVPGGYIFVDPFRGSAISDDKGKPVIFQPAVVSSVDKAAQAQQLDGSQPVVQTQEQKNIDQYGKIGAQMLEQQPSADTPKDATDNAASVNVATPDLPNGASDIAGTPPVITTPVVQQQQITPQETSTPIRLDRQGLQDEISKARDAAEKQFKDETRLVRTQKIRQAERDARDRWEKAGGKM